METNRIDLKRKFCEFGGRQMSVRETEGGTLGMQLGVQMHNPKMPIQTKQNQKELGNVENVPQNDAIYDIHDKDIDIDIDIDIESDRKSDMQEITRFHQSSVGIKHFISPPSLSFSGILKHRFNDFHVHEIDSDGNVVYLSNLGKESKETKSGPLSPMGPTENKATETPILKKQGQVLSPEQETDHDQRMQEILANISIFVAPFFQPLALETDAAAAARLDVFMAKLKTLASIPLVPDILSTPPMKTRALRTAFHGLIKELNEVIETGKVFIKSQTIPGPDSRIDLCAHENKRGATKAKAALEETRVSRADTTKTNIHFTLYKENRDTHECISLLSRLLGLDVRNFAMSGTKDKRGITVQRLSISLAHGGMSISRIIGLNKRLRQVRIGSVCLKSTKLGLGESRGNKFTIAIRQAAVDFESNKTLEQVVAESKVSLSTMGFINYFGMQRFGTRGIATHQVGRAMLAQEWKEACELVLSNDAVGDVFKTTGDAQLALNVIPNHCHAERAILQSLTRQEAANGKTNKGRAKSIDYLAALRSVSRNMRLMYVHSYQSRVWNEMASIRHERWGRVVVEGDLVRHNEHLEGVDLELDSGSTRTGVPICESNPGQDEVRNFTQEEGVTSTKKRGLCRVNVVTKDDVLNCRYEPIDLVLPLPGHSVQYPPNLVESYVSFMKKDGFDPMLMARKQDDINLPGFYRSLYGVPTGLEMRVVEYGETGEGKEPVDFIQSDLDLLQGGKPVLSDSDRGAGLKAVILEFSLESSMYATMVLREVMKKETASSFMSVLSKNSTDH